jgi:hypothetical protein
MVKCFKKPRPTYYMYVRRFDTGLLYPRSHPRDIISGRLLPSHALPPAIYYYIFYFEGVSSLIRRPGHRYRVSRKCVVRTPAGGQVSKVVGVACLESMNWVVARLIV